MTLINLKFCAPFKINIQKRKNSQILKTGFGFFFTISEEDGLRRKSKVCPLDTNQDNGYLVLKFSALYTPKQMLY